MKETGVPRENHQPATRNINIKMPLSYEASTWKTEFIQNKKIIINVINSLYFIDACEILRFPSDMTKTVYFTLLSLNQGRHNWKYNWAYHNEKQVLFFFNVLIPQTKV